MYKSTLEQIFTDLGATTRAALGAGDEIDSLRKKAEIKFRDRRKEIQIQLNGAVASRSKAVNRLNIAFYAVIAIIVIGVIIQLFTKSTNIVIYIQTACLAALFPISQKVERNVTKQAYLELTATFLPDLEPGEAIKAIDHLYQSMSKPDSLKESLKAD